MITIDDYYMGRDKTHDLTPELEDNAKETVRLVNLLLERSGFNLPVRSGWRPSDVNENTPHAAKNSLHITCEACDLSDLDKSFAAWCMANLHILEVIGLWLEHPDYTPPKDSEERPWVHVQIKPPKSGNRVFLP